MAEMKGRLATELDFYALHRDEWIRKHRACYVTVKDNSVLDFFPTFEGAYRAGVEAWGSNTDFLVKQVVDDEPTLPVF